MKEIKHEDLPNITGEEVVAAINTGAIIVNATFPFIKDLFGKIGEWFKSIQTDRLSTPHGKRVAIEELQKNYEILAAQNKLQRELNKIYDKALGLTTTE